MTQTWDPQDYAQNARFVSDLALPLLELLAPQPGERILDLGCGDGMLTRKIADLGGHVVAVDSSPEFILTARDLGLEAYVLDSQALPFEGEFDAVFSNAALHWIKRVDEVIAGVWRALTPGGRFVAEFGGEGNVQTLVGALHAGLERRGVNPDAVNPWYFPSVMEYRSRLEARGFRVHRISLIPRPTPLPGEIRGWLETFAQSFTTALPDDEREGYIEEVCYNLKGKLPIEGGKWVADYVRLRVAAEKPHGR